ncbi:serine protease 27-like [Styela clava]
MYLINYILIVFVAVLVRESCGQRWSPCSVTCGIGKQTKRVCKTFFGNCETYTKVCKRKKKCPHSLPDPIPKPLPTWNFPCSAACGGGLSCDYRGVCQQCNVQPCVKGWGEYTECSKKCGGGTRFKVDPCPLAIEKCKKTYEDCNVKPCPSIPPCQSGYSYRYGAESECCRKHDEKCGLHLERNPFQRIFGGSVSMLGEWPWVAVMVSKKTASAVCGGSIIHKRWILSAAHCTRGFASLFPAQDFYIRVGSIKISTPSVNSQRIEIQKFHPHEDYEHPLATADIALIELKTDITISSQARPICLPKLERVPEDTNCVIAGFGFSETSNGAASDDLRHVTLRVLPMDACQNALKNIPETQYISSLKNLCVGRFSEGKDACRGDSGSAVACQRCRSCTWYVAATLSYGTGGQRCDKNTPGVYMRVEHFEGWIKKISKIESSGAFFC